ncbi:MAG: hypothetical protein ABFD82_03275 [Syntrophaceae bacterium]
METACLCKPFWKKKVGNCPLITNVQDDFHGIPNTEKMPMQEKIEAFAYYAGVSYDKYVDFSPSRSHKFSLDNKSIN